MPSPANLTVLSGGFQQSTPGTLPGALFFEWVEQQLFSHRFRF